MHFLKAIAFTSLYSFITAAPTGRDTTNLETRAAPKYLTGLSITQMQSSGAAWTFDPQTLCPWHWSLPFLTQPDSKESSLSRFSGECDVNKDFGGYYTWIKPIYSSDPTYAASGINFWTSQTKQDIGNEDLAKGTGGLYRYVDIYWDGSGKRVVEVEMLRSKSNVTIKPFGWNGMTPDMNQGRGGDYLYLVWRYG